jgi:hypothetical protein
VITPDAPDRVYSTRLRTALVLTGSGTAGAYHAGVLRALHEAGVKIDLVAGRGIGAAGAMFAAIDGGSRLWEPGGIWKGHAAPGFYAWRTPLRIAGWALVAAGAVLAVPLVLLALSVVLAIAGLLITLVGFGTAASALTSGYSAWIARIFEPSALPTSIPRLVLFAILVAAGALAATTAYATFRSTAKRRVRQGLGWVVGAPLSTTKAFDAFAAGLWHLIRGAAPLAAPERQELGRRYVELLAENLGQPGFREVLLIAHDMDARRDFVFALLADAHRPRFFGRPLGGDKGDRAAEAFDLAGVARDHAIDALAGALAMPIATEPHLIRFAPEGPWRGETHRLCDRQGSLARLLDEVAAAGAEQVILLAAAPHPGRAHELSAGRTDLRGLAGEPLASFEAAAVRDMSEQFAGRFAGLFVIRPSHNPLGPLDFQGVYDERSDRRQTLGELVDRGYEDAYRQFIEPVVGAGGEAMQAVQPGNGNLLTPNY